MIKVFPVAAEGRPRYTDDFGDPRSGGRRHAGNDLFATLGTAILASDDGVVGFYTDGIGGPSFQIRFDEGTRAYGTHLLGYAFDIALGADTRNATRRVRAGDVIGYVGKGGNAAGTPPHLHFQYWLANGQLVDPYPYLRAAEVRNAPSAPPSPQPQPLPAPKPLVMPATSSTVPVVTALLIVGAASAAAYAIRRARFRRLAY